MDNFDLPKEVQEILNKLSESGFKSYIVGGAVRDLLMRKKVSDWDFTTNAKPEEILKVFPDGYYNNQFGTVGIPSKNGIYEITTMRKEGDYQDSRHPSQVSWTNKIEEDLARRDFTVNAIALSEKGDLIDLFEGQKDLQDKIIRAVGDPDSRFKEDALRILRVFRFVSQLNFDIDEKTYGSVIRDKELLNNVSGERIREELFKLLNGLNPYISLKKMREAGMLGIILPELDKCFGIKQEGPKHDRTYDIGEHSLLTLKETNSSDPITKLAALLHDIGKADTFKKEADGNVTFYNHEVVSSRQVSEIAKRLKMSKKDSEKLFKLVRWHQFTVDEHQTDSAIRRFIVNIGVENIDDMLSLRIGDRLGGGTQRAVSWRMEEFKKRIAQVLEKPFSIKDLKVDGKDIMEVLKIGPGPRVGEILQKLFEEVLEDDSKNNREYLLEKIKNGK